MNTRQINRFRNLIRALREAPRGRNIDMHKMQTEVCGTPSCALGHYVHRTDLQKSFLPRGGGSFFHICANGTEVALYDSRCIRDHFGITIQEAEDLFGPWGCGDADTIPQVVRFLKSWFKEKGITV